MIVYCASCAASMLAAYLGYRRYKEGSRQWGMIFFIALPMILAAALRYEVGEDYTFTYVPYFEMVKQSFTQDYARMEILFHLLNKAVIVLGGDYVWVFAVCAVAFYMLVFRRIIDESPYPELSIFLITGMGFCFVFFNAMRQMVGAAILMYAMQYIRKRKLLPYLICIALACGFHSSCVVFLPMYWVGRIRIRPIMALILTVFILAISQAVVFVARQIIMLTRFAIYFSSVFDNGKTAYVMLLINMLLLFFYSLFYSDDEKYVLYYNLQMLTVWIIMFSGKIVLSLRVAWIFGLPSIISLPMAIHNMPKEKDRRAIVFTVGVLYLLYFLYTIGFQNSNNVLPYKSIFSR